MDLEGARMQLLLGMAFGPRLEEGQAEWRDVPEVVRSSFMLMAKELRRLHRLVLANRQDAALQRESETKNKNTGFLTLQDEVAQLRAQVQDAQRQANERHVRTKQKLSDLWGEVAATAQAAADAQTQHAASCEKVEASWAKAERQFKILEMKIEEQDRRRKRDKKHKLQTQQVDAALHELQKSQVLCSQELRRLQRVFEAHDHQVVGTTLQIPGGDAEKLKQDEKSKKGRQRSHDGAVHVLLHQRYVEALKRQQLQDRAGLSTVVEERASA